jgi:hypothetical protein
VTPCHDWHAAAIHQFHFGEGLYSTSPSFQIACQYQHHKEHSFIQDIAPGFKILLPDQCLSPLQCCARAFKLLVVWGDMKAVRNNLQYL